MPSSSEVEQYYGDYKLTNAISKRMGWYNLAAQLGLKVKESDTFFGKSYEAKATEQIIGMGYEVRRMPQNFPYDLLINNKVKIDVKVSRLYIGNAGNFYSFNLEKPFCTCDIYILYTVNNAIENTFIVPSKFVATNTQISIGEQNSKYQKYIDRWDYIEQYDRFMEDIS